MADVLGTKCAVAPVISTATIGGCWLCWNDGRNKFCGIRTVLPVPCCCWEEAIYGVVFWLCATGTCTWGCSIGPRLHCCSIRFLEMTQCSTAIRLQSLHELLLIPKPGPSFPSFFSFLWSRLVLPCHILGVSSLFPCRLINNATKRLGIKRPVSYVCSISTPLLPSSERITRWGLYLSCIHPGKINQGEIFSPESVIGYCKILLFWKVFQKMASNCRCTLFCNTIVLRNLLSLSTSFGYIFNDRNKLFTVQLSRSSFKDTFYT